MTTLVVMLIVFTTIAENPKDVTDKLCTKYDLKLKSPGPNQHHLGMGFCRDNNGI